jgi:hypothetical protein
MERERFSETLPTIQDMPWTWCEIRSSEKLPAIQVLTLIRRQHIPPKLPTIKVLLWTWTQYVPPKSYIQFRFYREQRSNRIVRKVTYNYGFTVNMEATGSSDKSPTIKVLPWTWRRQVLPNTGRHLQDHTALQPTRSQSTLIHDLAY